jgi:adenylosuccinate lyase
VGKRACLWLNDLLLDLDDLNHRIDTLPFRGVKGTTGTQASFLQLLGSGRRVDELEMRVAKHMGFERIQPVTGQTYSRKIDSQVVKVLAGIGESAVKIATDIRLLANRKEIEEPFGKQQVGSSAMAYKRNPMRSERICALGRYVIGLMQAPAMTQATQWLERTLDDSAGKRLYVPEAFLATDAVLILLHNVTSGLVVYPKMIARNLQSELPFMATEAILMAGVRAGGDRQDLHERIRVHSQAAAQQVKAQGKPNDLIERLKGDEAFSNVDIDGLMDPSAFVGRAPQQVDEFLAEVVGPIRDRYADDLAAGGDLRV